VGVGSTRVTAAKAGIGAIATARAAIALAEARKVEIMIYS
jgi:hypothetical protein